METVPPCFTVTVWPETSIVCPSSGISSLPSRRSSVIGERWNPSRIDAIDSASSSDDSVSRMSSEESIAAMAEARRHRAHTQMATLEMVNSIMPMP